MWGGFSSYAVQNTVYTFRLPGTARYVYTVFVKIQQEVQQDGTHCNR